MVYILQEDVAGTHGFPHIIVHIGEASVVVSTLGWGRICPSIVLSVHFVPVAMTVYAVRQRIDDARIHALGLTSCPAIGQTVVQLSIARP